MFVLTAIIAILYSCILLYSSTVCFFVVSMRLPHSAVITSSARVCFPSSPAYRHSRCPQSFRFPARSPRIPTTSEFSSPPAHRYVCIHKQPYSTSPIRKGEQQNPKYSSSERLRSLFLRSENSESQTEAMGSTEGM